MVLPESPREGSKWRAVWRKVLPCVKLSELDLAYARLEGSEQIARVLYLAMRGIGTDEAAINRELARVETQDEWDAVQVAFKVGDGSDSFQQGNLKAALESELSESELLLAKKSLWGDARDARVWYSSAVEDAVARLFGAMKGVGTAEQDIYQALSWVKSEEMWSA